MATAFLIITLLIIMVVGWILVVPIHLVIDTDRSEYMIRQAGVFSVRVNPGRERLLDMKVAGFRIDPVVPRKKDTRHREEKKSTKRSFNSWVYLPQRIIKSFTIERFVIDVDTDDYVLNANLFPLFQFASDGVYSLNVNFSGRNAEP
jgi:hypothetical protein